ncbi:hypothetical protein C5946_04665 [Cronobacter sakazakii]|nr:hypothetical protein C3D65_15430 [Cronobacter sakazakii]PPY53273.1 hypothetical protein C3D64_03540 [Cronobacter sakazakii]PQY10154.1 hypothetical protein C5956_08755 [Cronobacter sakazakii]PQY32406.1 hypothetical protein C5946_04665 [Cronobacter sakazakii]
MLPSVGALRLPTLQDDTIYACRAGKRSAPAISIAITTAASLSGHPTYRSLNASFTLLSGLIK